MSNLTTINYWFNLQPEALTSTAWNGFIGLLVSLTAATVIFALLKIRPGLYRGLFKRLYAFGATNILIGLMFLFFNYEQVPFFSARFWLGLWFIIMLIWLIMILRDLRTIPQKKKELTEQQERRKYLP